MIFLFISCFFTSNYLQFRKSDLRNRDFKPNNIPGATNGFQNSVLGIEQNARSKARYRAIGAGNALQKFKYIFNINNLINGIKLVDTKLAFSDG